MEAVVIRIEDDSQRRAKHYRLSVGDRHADAFVNHYELMAFRSERDLEPIVLRRLVEMIVDTHRQDLVKQLASVGLRVR